MSEGGAFPPQIAGGASRLTANPPFIYKWTVFALQVSERINMGSHRSHSVIFAVSFLIITSVQVPSPSPPTYFFEREVFSYV